MIICPFFCLINWIFSNHFNPVIFCFTWNLTNDGYPNASDIFTSQKTNDPNQPLIDLSHPNSVTLLDNTDGLAWLRWLWIASCSGSMMKRCWVQPPKKNQCLFMFSRDSNPPKNVSSPTNQQVRPCTKLKRIEGIFMCAFFVQKQLLGGGCAAQQAHQQCLVEEFAMLMSRCAQPGVSPNHLRQEHLPPVATSKMATSSRCFLDNTAPGIRLCLWKSAVFWKLLGSILVPDTSARDHPFTRFFFHCEMFKWSISRIKSCERFEKYEKEYLVSFYNKN